MTEWTDWHERHSGKIQMIAGVDCWIWTAGANAGKTHGRVNLRGRAEYSHRAAFEAANGYMPATGMVCHSCGVGFCVRSSHLYHGDAASNGKDTSMMGRHGRATLNDDQVFALRKAYMDGDPLRDIADRYGIAFGTVYPIVMGRAYKHAPSPISMKCATRNPEKLSAQTVEEIRLRLKIGADPQSRIAKDYNVAQSVISRINTGKRWGGA